MATAVVIVAAGRGLRLGAPIPKQYLDLAGEPVLARTLRAALGASHVSLVQVAIAADAHALYDRAVAGISDPRLLPPVTGGADRAASVRAALDALEPHAPDAVLVHDAARPFAPATLFDALAARAEAGESAIAAEPVVDALWHGTDGMAIEPRPRAGLWRAQTPQAFPYPQLLAAHRAPVEGPPALDDAEVMRRAGHEVALVAGPPENFKITTPGDMDRAERMVTKGASMDIRIGHGFDVHRFGPGDHVWLCGVRIPHGAGLVGHSDADVGLHALSDAIYGALAEGDIGTHFPPSDPQWKGTESHVFLAHAGARVKARGGRIANLDVTLLCERPKIGPHAAAMRARMGAILALEETRISVKATTMETMGFVGREEGMGALATATVIL